MRISPLLAIVIVVLSLAGCAPTETPRPSFTKLPVLHDPRPMYVLFSWTRDSVPQFALVRERPTDRGEIGVARNTFLERFDSRHTAGFDLASLEEKLKVLPTSSLVDWFIDDARNLRLPPASIVQRVQRLVSHRKATLKFDNIKDWMASTHRMLSPI